MNLAIISCYGSKNFEIFPSDRLMNFWIFPAIDWRISPSLRSIDVFRNIFPLVTGEFCNFSLWPIDEICGFLFSTRLIDEFHEFFTATVSRILQFPATDWRISRFFGLSMDEFRDFCFRTTYWRISRISHNHLVNLSILFHTTNLDNFVKFPRDLMT